MRIFDVLGRWLFILSIPVLLISASLALAFNTPALYRYGFNKYNISQVSGIAPAELNKATLGLIAYFNSDETNINVVITKDGKQFTLFNEREIVHLKDVKDLVWLDYHVALYTLAYALAYAALWLFMRRARIKLASYAVAGCMILLGLMALGAVGVLFNFDQLFLQFHLISFNNDTWLLDPSKDYLVMLFPSGFWEDATIFCLGVAALGAIVVGGLSLLVIRRNKDSE